MFVKDRIHIPELRRKFYGDRNPYHGFDQMVSDQACMHRCTACSHNDPVDAFEQIVRYPVGGKVCTAVVESWHNGIFQCLRLVIDFFLHKVIISALLSSGSIPVNVEHFWCNDVLIHIIEYDSVFFHAGQLPG